MTNLAENTIPESYSRGGVRSYVIVDAVELFGGALVGITAAGFLDNWNNIATTKFQGILLEGATGDTSALPQVEGRVDTSGPTLTGVTLGGSPTQASVGALVYSADGNPASLTLTPGLSDAVGKVVRYDSATSQDVELFTPAEA